MPNSKPKSSSSSSSSSNPSLKAFTKKEYYPSLAYHLSLLFASFLFLPRARRSLSSSSSSSYGEPVIQLTSADRPEWAFLTPITSNPTRTLIWYIIGETVCVMLWGQHLATWSGVERPRDKDKRVAQNLQRLRDAATATAIAVPTMGIMLLLLGAPVHYKTALLAAQAALLIVWAPVHALGLRGAVNSFRLTRLFSSFSPESPFEKAILYPAVGAVLGGWVGGGLLALDWDRPWQAYPLTPSFGMLVGYTIGHLSH